ncbi:hypothetical protein D3C74_222340 [compost metagenome]
MDRDEQVVAVVAAEQAELHQRTVFQIDARLNVIRLSLYRFLHVADSLEIDNFQIEQRFVLPGAAVPGGIAVLGLAVNRTESIVMHDKLTHRLA